MENGMWKQKQKMNDMLSITKGVAKWCCGKSG